MKKNILLYSKVLENAVFEKIISRKGRIIFLVITIGILKVLSGLPYINSILGNFMISVFAIFLSVLLLGIKEKTLILWTLVLFLPAMALLLLGRTELAEIFANFIYILLLSTVIRGVLNLKPEKN